MEKQILELAKRMIDDNKDRDTMMSEMDRMDRCEWDFPYSIPEKVKNTWRKTVSTTPHDVLVKAEQGLSGNVPHPRVAPLSPGPEDQKKANSLEKFLEWHFELASQKRLNTKGKRIERILSDHAPRYDMLAAQVVYLPSEIKAYKDNNLNPKELERSRMYGDYTVIVHHPMSVYKESTDHALKSVLLVKHMPIQEVLDFWGTNSDQIRKAQEEDKEKTKYATVYDLEQVGKRWVWCYLSETDKLQREGKAVTILDGVETGRDFIPWAIPGTGASPMLDGIMSAHKWEDENILKSLNMSKLINNFYMADFIQEGGYEIAEVDTTDPSNKVLKAPEGARLRENQAATVDQGAIAMEDRVKGDIHEGTVTQPIMTGQFPGNTAFSTVNALQGQTASRFDMYRQLVEAGLGEIFRIMLLLAHNSDEEITTDTESERIILNSESGIVINPDMLNVRCELIPTIDQDMQRKATVIQIAQQAGFSQNWLYKLMNVADPNQMKEEVMQEQFENMAFQNMLKVMGAQGDAEALTITGQAQMALQMQGQQMMMQQQQQGNPEQASMPLPEGQAANPAMGGDQAVNAGNATFEGVTGTARDGGPIQ